MEETEYFLDVGDSIEVDGRTITLFLVYEDWVTIEIDGFKIIVKKENTFFKGIKLRLDKAFCDETHKHSSATIIITSKINYKNGGSE